MFLWIGVVSLLKRITERISEDMRLLCRIGLHNFKKISKKINGHGQVIENYSCSCGLNREDVVWYIANEGIIEKWSTFTNSKCKLVKETDVETFVHYKGNEFIKLDK